MTQILGETTNPSEALQHLRTPIEPATEEQQIEIAKRAEDLLRAKGTLGVIALRDGILRPYLSPETISMGRKSGITINATKLVHIGNEHVGLLMKPNERLKSIDMVALTDTNDIDRYPAILPGQDNIVMTFRPTGNHLKIFTPDYVRIADLSRPVLPSHIAAAGILLDAIDAQLNERVLASCELERPEYPQAFDNEPFHNDGKVIQLGF